MKSRAHLPLDNLNFQIHLKRRVQSLSYLEIGIAHAKVSPIRLKILFQHNSVRTNDEIQRATMHQKINKELLQYWNEIRGSRAAPRRIEISPTDISAILPQTFILEIKTIDEFIYRLAGSTMCDTFGSEFRGQNFFSNWPSTEQSILKKYLTQLINDGAVISINFTARSDNNHEGEFEMIFLPLIHEGTHIDRILGSVTPIEPYPWLGLTKLEFCSVTNIHLTICDKATLNAATSATPIPLSFDKSNRLIAGNHCQLRVFEGGKSKATTATRKSQDKLES